MYRSCIKPRSNVDKSCNSCSRLTAKSHQLSSTLTGLNFAESLRYCAVISSELSSTLMQLLFSFDRGFSVFRKPEHLTEAKL
jgi:hypothetical protein